MVLAALLLGLAVGSFLNVVVSRLPAQRSLVRPRSACPACGAAIAWHDNIPILSFLMLRARCRACEIRISWRYPLLEAATALGVEFVPCQMTMDMFGLTRDDLIDEMGEPAGAATAIEIMTEADASLFI